MRTAGVAGRMTSPAASIATAPGTTPRARRGAGRALLLACALAIGAVAGGSAAQAPARHGKLVEWGWDEPDTRFLRDNVVRMEALPFDGVVLHVLDARGRNLAWEAFGRERFTRADVATALADLHATRFTRFTENFLRVNATPGDVDWFDDAAWSTVRGNFALAAAVAREARLRGLLFDPEHYKAPLFDPAAPANAGHAPAALREKVRARGREWMRAVTDAYPGLVLFMPYGYQLARAHPQYALFPSFLDGVYEACGDGVTIVDGWEFAYGYKTRAQFAAGYRTIRTDGLAQTAAPERYRTANRAAFGLWLDYGSDRRRWNPEDVARNHFTPAEFEGAVRSALDATDGYVWIYSQQPRWWTGERLPAAYVDALRAARDAAAGARR